MKLAFPALLALTLALTTPPGPSATRRSRTDDVERVERRPNVVLILTDDQGYGDLSCMGHPTIKTPRIDALAAGGRRFTQFYVASSVCSPSRAAFMTGCYPRRIGMHDRTISPGSKRGLHPDEVTLGDALGAAGYATGFFGKWHLGHRPGMLPTDQGFDRWFGIPYSNDMSRVHRKESSRYPYRLPLMRGEEVVEWEPDQRLFTRRFTEEAIAFIEENEEGPFLVYLAHVAPHVPLYASAEFEGKSLRGPYGDAIEEIDWSVGAIVDALAELGLLDDTLILFTSDNGPYLRAKLSGGCAGPLRGMKGTAWEAGQRVPFVVHWPGHVPPATVCREVVTALDLLPTIAGFAGAELDESVRIDGHDVGPLLLGVEGATSPTDAFLYYRADGSLAGVRRGPWKLLLDGPNLFDVEQDVGEQFNRAEKYPELVTELAALAWERNAEITAHARPALRSEKSLFDPRK